jgi:hypothetical protein
MPRRDPQGEQHTADCASVADERHNTGLAAGAVLSARAGPHDERNVSADPCSHETEIAMRTALSLIAIWLLINVLLFVLLTRVDKSAR